VTDIYPQQGFQTDFLSSEADIVIGGGAAGVGKTFALLLEPARHIENNPKFGGVFFRRTYPQITNEGALWDTSAELYFHLKGKMNENNLEWIFPSGASIKFSHLQHEKNIYDFQGAQIPFIAFDELTHFTEKMFFYLLSRNRSTCGVKPYVRATCNPDPDSWVARFIEWWINQDTGFPILERSGVIRYFIRDAGVIVWGDSVKEVLSKVPHVLESLPKEYREDETELGHLVKSVTFIAGNIYDNKKLMDKDPEYIGNLLAQDDATKQQLLFGNWKVKPDTTSLIEYPAILDSFSNEHVPEGKRYITADIALHGSDMFVIFVWSGLRVIDVAVMSKSNGAQVEQRLKELAKVYSVPQSQIVYDADGVGGFLKGYLMNAVSFNNGAASIQVVGNKQNYKNLKTQCYYLLADVINKANIFISPKVANEKVNAKFIRDQLISESMVIKKYKSDEDGKLRIIPKEQMKNMLGHSPDYMDAMMMRMYFEIRQRVFTPPKVYV